MKNFYAKLKACALTVLTAVRRVPAAISALVLGLSLSAFAAAQTFGVEGDGATLTAPQIVSVADYTTVFNSVGVVGAAVLSMAVAVRVVRWVMSLIV